MSDQPVTEIRPHDSVLLVVVQKRSLDEISTQQLTDEVLTAASRIPKVPVVLDLSRVRFAPSVALGSLVQLSKSFKLDRRRVALIGVERRILEAIRVTRLDTVLEIHGTLQQVIDASPKTP